MPAFTLDIFATERAPEVRLLAIKLSSHFTQLLFLYFLTGKVFGSKLLSTNGLNVKLPFYKLQEKRIKSLSQLKSAVVNGKCFLQLNPSLASLSGFGQPNPINFRILISYQ